MMKPIHLTLAASMATAFVSIQPAWSQSASTEQPIVKLQLPDQPDQPEIDLSQLRRYAAQGDFARVDAEVRRLQTLYPEWVPPNDLYGEPPVEAGGSDIDVSYLWAVYQAGDMAAVNDEIAILKRLNPGWQPPADLIKQVQAAQTKELLKKSAEIEDWQGIARFYAANPTQFVCDDITIESIWIAAEAHAKLGQKSAAANIYSNAIDQCRSAELRLSSLQKAMASIERSQVDQLIAAETGKYRNEANEKRFAAIKSDWQGDPESASRNTASARFGTALQAAGEGSIGAKELSWLEAFVDRKRDHNGAMVLGWHYFNKDRLAESARWFESSMSWQANAKAAEGLSLVYTKQNRPKEAEQIALAWADRVDGLDDVLDSARLQQVWNAINDERPGDALALIDRILVQSPDHAETRLARGWALISLGRSSEAWIEFEDLLADKTATDDLKRQAAHGVALAAIDRGDLETARRTMTSQEFTADIVDDIEREIQRQEASQSFFRAAYKETYVRLNNLKSRWPDHYQLDEMEGWTLYHLGHYKEALDIFQTVYSATNSPDADAGITAAQLQLFGFD